jgi:hypothetical protein
MILSARYANPDNTAIVAVFDDIGAKALSAADTPDLWDLAVSFGPTPYVPPVPASVTPVQARRALRAAGLYDTVVSTVAASTDPDIQDTWEYAGAWERNNPHINNLAVALGLSPEQVDDLFRVAAQL